MSHEPDEKPLSQQMDEFADYLVNCTNNQIQGVYDKERSAGRMHFALLARAEAEKRHLDLALPEEGR